MVLLSGSLKTHGFQREHPCTSGSPESRPFATLECQEWFQSRAVRGLAGLTLFSGRHLSILPASLCSWRIFPPGRGRNRPILGFPASLPRPTTQIWSTCNTPPSHHPCPSLALGCLGQAPSSLQSTWGSLTSPLASGLFFFSSPGFLQITDRPSALAFFFFFAVTESTSLQFGVFVGIPCGSAHDCVLRNK